MEIGSTGNRRQGKVNCHFLWMHLTVFCFLSFSLALTTELQSAPTLATTLLCLLVLSLEYTRRRLFLLRVHRDKTSHHCRDNMMKKERC